MDPFNTSSDLIDLVFEKLEEEDLHETFGVSKAWFWASLRRMKTLKITWKSNQLKSMADYYNKHRGSSDEMDWRDLFKHLVLDKLIVDTDEAAEYLVNNGCNTASLVMYGGRNREATVAFLKKITRLQWFEYHPSGHPNTDLFLSACFHSFDCGYGPSSSPIRMIKLKSGQWDTEDAVLLAITQITVSNVSLSFLCTLLDRCSNLEELHYTNGQITQEWHQILPANVKRMKLLYVDLEKSLASVVGASTDSARQLLSYLSQNWEFVEEFYCYYSTDMKHYRVYQLFPQQREEVFECLKEDNMERMNLESTSFRCREFRVERSRWSSLEPVIPSAKTVKFRFYDDQDFEFSPQAACLEPHQVECLTVCWPSFVKFAYESFAPDSFEGFTRLTCLALSHVSSASIKIALDQCPYLKKLKLEHLQPMTVRKMSYRSSYRNVVELDLLSCQEPIHKVFEVFPCILVLTYFQFPSKTLKSTTDWLCQRLTTIEKKYGVVGYANPITFVASDDLNQSLRQAQHLLGDNIEYRLCECYLKGFKLISRSTESNVSYIS